MGVVIEICTKYPGGTDISACLYRECVREGVVGAQIVFG
jgi:hypothetical protein